MKKHNILLAIILCAMLLIPSVAARSATFEQQTQPQPQADAPGCYSLDVVFIIDQSSSMAGDFGVPANDPLEQRENAPKAMIDELVSFVVDRCKNTHHRIGVISFGTDPRADLLPEGTMADIQPQTFQEGQELKERLKNYIHAEELGATDPKSAFEMAHQMLSDAAIPASDGPRKRVIFLVTDGIPCVPSLGCVKPSSTFDFRDYSRQMQTQINELFTFDPLLAKQDECLKTVRIRYGDEILEADQEEQRKQDISACYDNPRIPNEDYAKSTYVYMLLLQSGETYSKYVRDIYDEIAIKHGGTVYDLKENSKEIPTIFKTVLSDLSGLAVTSLKCGTFAVNPYLERMNLVFYKIDPLNSITLTYTDKDGIEHELTSTDTKKLKGFDVAEHIEDGANERYTINNPYPGLWNLRADSCQGLDAYYTAVEINPSGYTLNLAEIPQYDRPPYHNDKSPNYLEYVMRDESGKSIDQVEPDLFAVQFKSNVTAPDGNQISYSMVWQPDEHLFRSAEPLQVPLPGVYKVDYQGETFYHEGKPSPVGDNPSGVFSSKKQLFTHQGMEFKVFEVIPFQIRQEVKPSEGDVLKPIHGTILDKKWPLPINEFDIEIELVDRDNNAISPDDIFTDPSHAYAVTLTGQESGKSISVDLNQVSEKPNLYRATIKDFEEEGIITASVQLTAGYNENFRPESNQPFSWNFSRIDVFYTRAQFYTSMMTAILVLIGILIIYTILIRLNPVKGTLHFIDGATERGSFQLRNGKHWKDLRKKDIDKQVPEAQIKSIHITPLNPNRSSTGSDGFGVPSTSNDPGIRVQGRMKSGQAFSIDLPPDIPMSYAPDTTETFIQMKFEPLS